MEDNRKKGRSQLLAIILVVVLAAGAGFGGGVASVYLAATYFPDLMPTVIYRNGDVTIETVDTLDVGEAIYEKVEPSVVGISTISEQQVATFFGYFQILEQTHTGNNRSATCRICCQKKTLHAHNIGSKTSCNQGILKSRNQFE